MKISILLPYKENYSPDYPGAVSLFIKSTSLISNYKDEITIYGSTSHKKNYLKIMLILILKEDFLEANQKNM